MNVDKLNELIESIEQYMQDNPMDENVMPESARLYYLAVSDVLSAYGVPVEVQSALASLRAAAVISWQRKGKGDRVRLRSL